MTNDRSNSRSSSFDNQSISDDESCLKKRRPRRVRSLIKSSLEKIMIENETKPLNTKHNSTTSPVDKRPFPFGQW